MGQVRSSMEVYQYFHGGSLDPACLQPCFLLMSTLSQKHHVVSYCFPSKSFFVEQTAYVTEQMLSIPSLIWSIYYSANACMATFFFQGHQSLTTMVKCDEQPYEKFNEMNNQL